METIRDGFWLVEIVSVSAFIWKRILVTGISQRYRENDRRQNYTTPKSFLEQIKLYENLLRAKRTDLLAKMERLENGLQKLQSTAAQVDDLKLKLAAQEVELKQKNEDADKLIEKVFQKMDFFDAYSISMKTAFWWVETFRNSAFSRNRWIVIFEKSEFLGYIFSKNRYFRRNNE